MFTEVRVADAHVVPIIEPTSSVAPVVEPWTEEEMAWMMPFSKPIRDWWIRAWGGKSGDTYYSEEHGWVRSDAPADEVHHIVPESELIAHGQEPDQTPAMPLSRDEHTGTGSWLGELIGWGQQGHSMHPDMGEAREAYRRGDVDAFKKAAKHHREQAAKGEKIVNTDEQLDGWLTEQAKEVAHRYTLEHPDDPKPTVNYRTPRAKKHWTDFFFGTKEEGEDQDD